MTSDDRQVAGAAAQPRRLALLAILAVAADRAVTREKIVAHLWPDNDEERARRALTQALYALRQDLGCEDAFLGVKDLRLNPEMLTTDVQEFRAAIRAGSLDRAAALYRGPFLDGFHLPAAGTFEEWAEREREGLAQEYTHVLEELGKRAAAQGNHRAAVGWWKKLAGLDPLNAQVALALMKAQVASGDQAAALQHARVYEALLKQELDLPPDREVVTFAEQLRRGLGEPRRTASAGVAPPAPTRDDPAQAFGGTEVGSGVISSDPEFVAGELSDDEPIQMHTSGWAAIPFGIGQPTAPQMPSSRRVLVPSLLMISGAIALTIAAAWWTRINAPGNARGRSGEAVSRVVAVGQIADYTDPTRRAALALPLSDMLATNLARAGDLQVVSSARMFELVRQLAAGGDTAAVVATAARQAGANELVDGALYEMSPGRLRLDLRRVDLSSGAVLEAYTVEGADLFALADSGTHRVVAALGVIAPEGSIASVSTRSVAAYEAYEEGLRTYFSGDRPAAEQLFAKALAADSAFAMAQFYYATCISTGDRVEFFRRLRRARDLSTGASDRERLLIAASWAFANSSGALKAIAETLTVRYPAELEGFLYAGQGAILDLDFAGARKPLHEVIARDSLGLRGEAVRCLACEALMTLTASYQYVDSIGGALRVSRLWTKLQPASGVAWRHHAAVLAMRGWGDSAMAALHVADSLTPDPESSARYLAAVHAMLGDYQSAEQVLRVQMQTGDRLARADASWSLANVLRQEGRFAEALDLARAYRVEFRETAVKGSAPSTAFLEAQIHFDRGEFAASAALFDSLSRSRTTYEDSTALARNWVWTKVHMADALAAMGDTVQLSRIADSIRVMADVSGFGRDQRLHYHVIGLLLEARGYRAQAVSAFQRSLGSPNSGFTRTNYELAGLLLQLKRPRDAIPTLQAALRGGLEGGNLYITLPELEGRLAQAWEAAGKEDSAAVHYRRVVQAWQRADPVIGVRRAVAEQALQRLGESPR